MVEEGLNGVVAWTAHMQVPPLRIAKCRDASVGMTAVKNNNKNKGKNKNESKSSEGKSTSAVSGRNDDSCGR
ncbi:MAG: hypothetical protein P4L10_08790 [Acidobacteriaceae bacterium]|nr:hypothetical protein [Acidobacteriaceae bacterium]